MESELGVSPSAETVRLYEEIRDNIAQKQNASEGTSIPRVSEHNLPAPLTAFVGREALLLTVNQALQDSTCRLITLLGPGGSGKTRLALE